MAFPNRLGLMLEFKNVGRTFEGTHGPVEALSQVSFTVEQGELLAVRGPRHESAFTA